MLYVVGFGALVVGFAVGYGVCAERHNGHQKRFNDVTHYWFYDDKPLKITPARWTRIYDVLHAPRAKEE